MSTPDTTHTADKAESPASTEAVSPPVHPHKGSRKGDPARRAAAKARTAAILAAREAEDDALFTSTADRRPVDLPSQFECDRLLDEAETALAEAHRARTQAKDATLAAAAFEVERQDLLKLAFTGNVVAQDRLNQQIRAAHPALTGFTPAPGDNQRRSEFHRDVKDIGVMLDLPTTGLDEDYFDALAEALRAFVRHYTPRLNSPKYRVGNQPHAHAVTRVGTVLYHPHPKRPAFFRHPSGTGESTPDVSYPTLEKALAALPALLTVGTLAGRTHPGFRDLG